MVYASNSYKQKMIENGLDQPEAQYAAQLQIHMEEKKL